MIKSKAIKTEMAKMRLDQPPTLRERVFFVVVMGGLLLIFVNIYWTPQSKVIEKRRSEARDLIQQVEALQAMIETTRLQLTMEQTRPQKELNLDERTKKMLERKVVDPLSEIHNTVNQLSSRRLAQGVVVDNIDIGDKVERETYILVPLSMHLTARYGSIQGYITAVKNLNRPIVVRKFNLSRSAGGGGQIEMTVDMELYIPKN